jgi:predicted dehydrogenase
MSTGPMGIGVVGAGVISAQYLRNLAGFPDLKVLGIADLDVSRARAAAQEYGIPVAGDLDAVLAIPEVELVINLTLPAVHAAVAGAVLQAGKHVYGEKPLALHPGDGAKLLDRAAELGLRVGNAPDTFLGAGIQSAKRAIEAGVIGTPVAASTAIMNFGPETWHPSPEFLFQRGAGPLFDIGPYYLTALVALLGPARRVGATAGRGREQRVIGSGPRAGTVFTVEVPTHVNALIDFTGGRSAASIFSFDSALRRTQFEVTGTEGTLWVPDPNTFEGPLMVRGAGDQDWREIPVTGTSAGRGLGVLDMVRAIRQDRPHRASGHLAQHVLETMTAIADSAENGEFRSVDSDCPVPEALPAEWDPHTVTLG